MVSIVNTYAKDSKENKKDHLEKVPVAVIRNLEHNKLPGPVGVHGLQGHRAHKRTKKTAPHGLGWEVVTHFLGEIRIVLV